MATAQNKLDFARSSADKILYLKHIQSELDEIRQETEEVYTSDDEIDRVPDSAYEEATLLLGKLLDYENIPMPHIGWAEDGSIGFEWRPDGGIVTIGIYGDGLVIYCVFFNDERQVEGICPLSEDIVLLSGFLETLNRLF